MRKKFLSIFVLLLAAVFACGLFMPPALADTPVTSPSATDQPVTSTPGPSATDQPEASPSATEQPVTSSPSPSETEQPAPEQSPTDQSLAGGTPGDQKGDTAVIPPFTKIDKENMSEAESKLSSSILQLVDEKYLPKGMSKSMAESNMEERGEMSQKSLSSGSTVDKVHAYIKLNDGASFDAVKKYVPKLENCDPAEGLATAWVDLNVIEAIASLDEVQSIHEVIPPVVQSGSLDSQGDSLLKADLARANMGVDGTGVKVGVISDGARSYSGSVKTGDLPPNLHIIGTGYSDGDEGTAMLEIVHDLAPGAELYFHEGGENNIAFCNAVQELADAGCKVICDDLLWINEPFFQDGYVASHVNSIINKYDIVYCSSAGNEAFDHFQGSYKDLGDDVDTADLSEGMDPSDPYLYIDVPNGDTVTIIMEWNDKFGSSSDDYDMFLYGSDGWWVAYSIDNQKGRGDDPIEGIIYTNDSYRDETYKLKVYANNSAAIKNKKTLEIYVYLRDGGVEDTNRVTSDSIFGQAALSSVLACGAVDANPGDNGNNGEDPSYYRYCGQIEWFSSLGPVTMISGTRNKPDVCGADGVSVTGAGGFENPFYGTSAASPHIAAIAALVRERYPSLTASQVRDVIKYSADDKGAPGFDNQYGYGLADALSAVNYYHSVTFNSLGGSIFSTQLVGYGSCVASKTPTRNGYYFGGWYTSTDFADASKWSFGTPVTSDITFYAKWTPKTPSINAKATDYKSVRISWKAVGNTLGYAVYRSNSEAGTYDFLADAGGALSYTDTGLQGGIKYYYKVCGYYTPYSVKIYGSLSPAKSATPVWPSITLKASAADYDSITLKWNAISHAKGYEVWRCDSSNGSYTKIADNVPSNIYTDDGATTGVRHYYEVRAFDNSSSTALYSGFSKYKYASTVPGGVSGLTLTQLSANGITVSWSAAGGATGYEVYRSTSKKGAYKKVGDTADLSFDNTGLAAGKTYYYKIRTYCKPGAAKVYGNYSGIQSLKI